MEQINTIFEDLKTQLQNAQVQMDIELAKLPVDKRAELEPLLKQIKDVNTTDAQAPLRPLGQILEILRKDGN